MGLMSQRAYARHRKESGLTGTTLRAVQKAIEAGRIKLNSDGLIDAAAADKAWEANSSTGHRRHKEAAAKAPAKKTAKKPAPSKATPKPAAKKPLPSKKESPAPPPPLEASEEEGPPDLHAGVTFAEANTAEKYWKAKLAELEYQEKSGQLVRAEEIAARWAEILTISKTKILAVPAKSKARIPRLTAADVGIIDELVREALEELADTELEEPDEEGDDGT